MTCKRIRKGGDFLVKRTVLLTIDEITLVKILIGRTLINFTKFVSYKILSGSTLTD